MEEKLLIPAMKDSLIKDWEGTIEDLLEVPLDDVLDDSILKDIPIVGTVSAICKTGIRIREKHLVKETLLFVKALNEGGLSKEKILKYKEALDSNPKRTKKELERIMLILDSHISSNQSVRLGHFYKAYINNAISWEKFSELMQANQRIFEEDVKSLVSLDKGFEFKGSYKGLRLSSLGLIKTKEPTLINETLVIDNLDYELTGFGKMFIQHM